MHEGRILIAGGGIAGLSLALTLHQVGLSATVFETSQELRPLGVGINLQPNAVRELYAMGIGEDDLDRVGVQAKEWALVGTNGAEIYAEPRGLQAGYKWPQYAVHRGSFHMLLADKVRERLGPDAIRLGERATGYEKTAGGVRLFTEFADGESRVHDGGILIGADGIHSNIRQQMHPDQPPIHWGGAIMWRGTAMAKPFRTGSSFLGLGSSTKRMVIYPISPPDPVTGLAVTNWIAEVTVDNSDGWQDRGWFKPVPVSDFVHHFENWKFDWLDVPALIGGSQTAYVNPMIDRDPIATWQDGPVALIGDAAHAMYPTGSNGASQAIIDGRVLGAAMLEHGVTPSALAAYDDTLCKPVGELVLRNRGSGPFGLLDIVDERCGGTFDDINEVISADERAAFMASYKKAAGFAMEQLNAAPPMIEPGERVL